MCKIFLQENENDCGWACISNLLDVYGLNISPINLKKEVRIHKEELSALDICNILDKYHVICEGYEVDNDYFKNKKGTFPIIAQIRKNEDFHFVLILKSDQHNLLVSDPAIGKYKISLTEFYSDFTKIILVPTKQSNFKTTSSFKKNFLLKDFIPYVPTSLVIKLFILTILVASFEIITSFYLKFIIDTLIPDKRITYLLFISSIIIIYVFIISLFSYIRNNISIYIIQNISENLFSNFIKNILNNEYLNLSKSNVGDFSTRLTDIFDISNNFIFILIKSITNLIILVVMAVFLSSSNHFFPLFLILYLICYLVLSNFFNKKYELYYHKSRDQSEYFENIYIKMMSYLFTVKAFRFEGQAEKNLNEEYGKNTNKIKKAFYIQNTEITILFLMQSLFYVLTITWMALQVIWNILTIGDFVFFATILQYMETSIQEISEVQPTFQKLKVSLSRVFNFMNNDNITFEKQLNHIGIDTITNINFNNVSLLENNQSTQSNLFNISINFNRNSLFGFTGKSGIGKTTLMNSLVRLSNVYGDISINNISIENISTKNLRENIIVLNQNPELIPTYASSIDLQKFNQLKKETSFFGLSEELNLQKISDIDKLISTTISGGQKQRLYICLALMLHPNLIILDESLSGLNHEWVVSIFRYIKQKKMNAIVISHETNILELTDEIIHV